MSRRRLSCRRRSPSTRLWTHLLEKTRMFPIDRSKLALFFPLFLLACGEMGPGEHEDDSAGDGDDSWGWPDGDGPGGPGDPGDCDYCDRPRPTAFSIDLEAAVGLALVSGEGESARLIGESGQGTGQVIMLRDGDEDGEKPEESEWGEEDGEWEDGNEDGEEEGEPNEDSLFSIDEEGELEPALEETMPEGAEELTEEELNQMWDPGPTPRVAAVGLSPDGSVYLVFEHSFVYKFVEDADTGEDFWSPSSPYSCQFFRTTGGWDGESVASDTLECVTNQHEIPLWRSDQVMQFDAEGKVYFPTHTPGSSKDVFYSYDPQSGELDEQVNANICWHEVEVTPRGSIFYTGTSADDGGDCNGTSFFRYIGIDGQLIEIARDWWDFKFLAEQNPDDPNSERIIFYGPDPRETGQPSWDSACIYRFDPQIDDVEARVSRVANCMNDIWGWINGDFGGDKPPLDARLLRKERCESNGQMFISGAGIQDLDQAADGTIYVAGEFDRKLPGEYRCTVEVSVDHCDTMDPMHDTPEVCEAAGGIWNMMDSHCSDPAYMDEWSCYEAGEEWFWGIGPKWYDGLVGPACLGTDDPAVADPDYGIHYLPGWEVQWDQCDPEGGFENGGEWVERVEGLAYIEESVDEEGSTLHLLSEEGEEVLHFWVMENEGGPHYYYSSYHAGTYSLRVAYIEGGEVVHRTLLSQYEVYGVSRDPSDSERIIFDGLYFPTNSYFFGSVNPTLPTEEEVLASMELMEGLTGQLETLIILPGF